MEIRPLGSRPAVTPARTSPAPAAGDSLQSGQTPDALLAKMAQLRTLAASRPPEGWARPAFSAAEVFTSPEKADAFLDDYLQREAKWFEIARDPKTMLTRDGWSVSPVDGKAVQPRQHSAPSKESLDIGLCVKGLLGDPVGTKLMGKGSPEAAKAEAVRILAGKIESFEKWHQEYPGYGGFLPWFLNTDKGIEPTGDWYGHCPGLDNGEWAWSMITAEHALRQAGQPELADRYKAYNDLLRTSAVKMYYDEKAGRVNGDVRISDPRSADATYSSLGHMTGEHGVHEGQMLLLYVTLLGKDLPADASQRVWGDTRMKRVEHEAGTTWQGFWGSSHESWSYLFLPYRDMPQFADLFRIREEIRTQNAADRGYPGLAASTNAPDLKDYYSDCGIEGIGTQPVRHNDVFAIYGAFPLLLQFAGQRQGNYGLAWLANMLGADKMYGPIGGLESGTNDGRQSAMVKTIDGSMPNLLALAGGLERETAAAMKDLGVYDGFKAIMGREYREAFGQKPLREPKGFALPPRAVG